MGQRNTPYNNLVADLEADRGGQIQSYGSLTAFPQHNVHSVLPVPVSGNVSNVYSHSLPDHHDRTLFYGMPQYNRSVHQHPTANLDPALAAPSNHRNPYMAPTPATRGFSIPVNHRTHDHISSSNNPSMLGIQTATHGTRGLFKIKSAERIQTATMVGSSSSAVPVIARVHESDASLMNFAPLTLPDHGDSSSVFDDGYQISVRNRPLVSGPDSIAAQNTNQFVHGNHLGAFRLSGNPWSDSQFHRSSGDRETWSWNQAVRFPYMHGSIVGPPVEAENMGMQGYEVRRGTGSLNHFVQHPIPLGHSNVHHLPQSTIQGMRGHNINFPPIMAVSSSRHANGPPTRNLNYFSRVIEAGPRYVGPLQPTGVRLYRPIRRGFVVDTNYMPNRNIRNTRVTPEDGVAVLEVPGHYNGIGDSADQHRDMRMDIDHMSYEELLALGEHIGSVTTGLSEGIITSHLKTRPFSSSKTLSISKSAECSDQNTDLCVICQNDYKDQENIGTVECGHAYHADCIRKWLIVKNSCPVCKSTALSMEPKDL